MGNTEWGKLGLQLNSHRGFMDPRIALLLESLDRGYNLSSWHGPNLRGALKGVRADLAAKRPGRDRHNIWEVAVHCAYWKYVVRRRLLGEKRGSFPLKGSNFFLRPEGRTGLEKAWTEDMGLLEEVHQSLRDAVATFDPVQLDVKAKGGGSTAQRMILGVAAHDIYHAGQIQLVKRLVSGSGLAKSKK